MKKQMILLAGCMIALCGCGKTTTIEMDQYITVDYRGLNTRGQAVIDKSGLEQAIRDAVEEKAKDSSSIKKSVNTVLSAYQLKIDQDEFLSNGDVVTVTADINNDICKEEKIKLTCSEITSTVNGLEEVPVYTDEDLFKDVHVAFSGISPNATASVTNDSTDPILRHLNFKIDQDTGLKLDDTITVSCTSSDGKDFLYDPEAKTSKNYQVSNIPAYISSSEEIPAETLKQIMEVSQTFLEHMLDGTSKYDFILHTDRASNMWLSKMDYCNNVKLEKIYGFFPKAGATKIDEWNRIVVIYTMDVQWDNRLNYNGVTCGFYMEDLVLNADGTVDTIIQEDFDKCGCSETFEKWRSSNSNVLNTDSYDMVEIPFDSLS